MFILAATWRSGSTLMQRLVASSGEVFVWGEPYADSNLVQRLRESVTTLRRGHPREDFIFDKRVRAADHDSLARSWIANLYPPLDDLVEAHRSFFRTLFAVPARDAGFARWGLKEVRLGGDDLLYLRFLFPRAKFLIIYRNPVDSYRSYLRYRTTWYHRWPANPVTSPKMFGTLWQEQLSGLLRVAPSTDAHVVRFEDLISRRSAVDECRQYLGLDLDRRTLDVHRGGKATEPIAVHGLERWALRRAAEPLLSDLGY